MHLDDLYRALDDVALDSFNAAINGTGYDRSAVVYEHAKRFVVAYEHEHGSAQRAEHDPWFECRGHCSGTVHHSGHKSEEDCARWDNRAGA